MAAITVGVPIYNGGDLLGRSLENLRQQSFEDFEVIVLDNCSTDDSRETVQAFVDEDPRFTLFVQLENKGPLTNFAATRDAPWSAFFLWRTYDDTCDTNYLEMLWRRLTSDPSADLAVGRRVGVREECAPGLIAGYPDLSGREGIARKRDLLLGYHAAWFYGLYRTEAIWRAFHWGWRAYPQVWAHDHIALLPFLLDKRIAYEGSTSFYQYETTLSQSRNVPAARLDKLRVLLAFYRAGIGYIEGSETLAPVMGGLRGRMIMLRHAKRCTFKVKHLIFGDRPPGRRRTRRRIAAARGHS